MLAVRFHEHGGPEKLVYEECPDPQPGKNEALIQVKAVALNRLDLWVRQGIPAYPVTLPHILGSDIAGVILEGDSLGKLKPGDEVVVYPGRFCGLCQACTTGREHLCAHFQMIGGHIAGGYAQKVVVPSAGLLKKPAKLDWANAAAFPLTFITAWHMLAVRAKLKEGETVLVVGASSGVGVAAIQIARHLGARVIAHTTSEEKVERIRAIGANEVIAGHPSEISSKVLALTEQHGADVVVEHVGPATWAQSLLSVAKGGRVVTCGATTGAEVSLVLRQLYMKEVAVFGSQLGSLADFTRVTQMVTQGKFKPVVDQVLPLSRAKEGHEALLAKAHVGKIVMEVPQ